MTCATGPSVSPFAMTTRRGFWGDMWWQIHCKLDLVRPPIFRIEERIANDRFYRFLERTWMWQQLPVAVALFAIGDWAWVFWGVCLRVTVGLHGHWLIGHLAHRGGGMDWEIEGLPVQGYNVPGVGLLTFGEGYHNNHHAFPHSAKLGIARGQIDPGWWFVVVLSWLGLASSIRLPSSEPAREGLRQMAPIAAPTTPQKRHLHSPA